MKFRVLATLSLSLLLCDASVQAQDAPSSFLDWLHHRDRTSADHRPAPLPPFRTFETIAYSYYSEQARGCYVEQARSRHVEQARGCYVEQARSRYVEQARSRYSE